MKKEIQVWQDINVIIDKTQSKNTFSSLNIKNYKIEDYIIAQNILTVINLFSRNSFHENQIEICNLIFSKRQKDREVFLRIESKTKLFDAFYLSKFDTSCISNIINRLFSNIHQINSFKGTTIWN